MPLVVDQLQLWIIGFRWAGVDPNQLWFRIPTPVRDNFTTLLDAILQGQLECLTLAQEKYTGDDPETAKYHLRYWLDDVNGGALGQSYSRELLKHAVIERWAFQEWCERRTIPLPEFWFPPGWTDYRWPQEDFEPIPLEPASPATESPAAVSTRIEPSEQPVKNPPEEAEAPQPKLRPPQLARIVSQQIARVVWKDEPTKTIAAMCKDPLVQKYGGADHYGEEAVRRWMQEVAPPEVSAKRGRPKKNNPTESD